MDILSAIINGDAIQIQRGEIVGDTYEITVTDYTLDHPEYADALAIFNSLNGED